MANSVALGSPIKLIFWYFSFSLNPIFKPMLRHHLLVYFGSICLDVNFCSSIWHSPSTAAPASPDPIPTTCPRWTPRPQLTLTSKSQVLILELSCPNTYSTDSNHALVAYQLNFGLFFFSAVAEYKLQWVVQNRAYYHIKYFSHKNSSTSDQNQLFFKALL